jgi:hypothetical protein
MAHRLKSSGRSRDQPILLPNLPPNLVTLPGPQRLAVIAYARAAVQAERANRAEREASIERDKLARLRKRAKHGVCPCCKRTFQQLARHMKQKHPEFSA